VFAICRRWGVPRADPATFRPIRSATPALVVTGQLDQITPPRYGRAVVAGLPHGRYLEVDGVGHSPVLAGGACTLRVVLRFLDDPSAPLAAPACGTP
jgi:pimeloyl-ACP methyl ester carboxylesterase